MPYKTAGEGKARVPLVVNCIGITSKGYKCQTRCKKKFCRYHKKQDIEELDYDVLGLIYSFIYKSTCGRCGFKIHEYQKLYMRGGYEVCYNCYSTCQYCDYVFWCFQSCKFHEKYMCVNK